MKFGFKNCTGNREFLYRNSVNSTEKDNSAHKLINWHWDAVPKAVSNSQEFLSILNYDFIFWSQTKDFYFKI